MKTEETKRKKIYIPPEITENSSVIADAALPSPGPAPAPFAPAPFAPAPAPFAPAPFAPAPFAPAPAPAPLPVY